MPQIHIWLPRKTKDAEGTAHDPKNGQFTSGQHMQAAGRHADQVVEARGQPGNGAALHAAAEKAHSVAAISRRENHPDADKHAQAAHAATAATKSSAATNAGSKMDEEYEQAHSKGGGTFASKEDELYEKAHAGTPHNSLKRKQDMNLVLHGAMSRAAFNAKHNPPAASKKSLAGPGGLYKNTIVGK